MEILEITGVTLTADGVVVELSDGTSALYSSSFLIEHLDEAKAVVSEDSEDNVKEVA
jgi:hypothetical protein